MLIRRLIYTEFYNQENPNIHLMNYAVFVNDFLFHCDCAMPGSFEVCAVLSNSPTLFFPKLL